MLKLLLDEHITPSVAKGLRKRHSTLLIHSLADWERGAYLGQDDATCMEHAGQQRLTLVTYNRRTIPPLLKMWTERGQSHGGVIFVDDKTIAPSDVGALVRALSVLVREAGDLDWKDRVCFLRR